MGCNTSSKKKVTTVSIRNVRRVKEVNQIHKNKGEKEASTDSFLEELEDFLIKPGPKGNFSLRPTGNQRGSLLYCEKGANIQFSVKGKWQLIESLGKCGPEGYTAFAESERGLSIGSLLCKVGGSNWFSVVDGDRTVAESSGVLIFKANNNVLEEEPEGFLDITVSGASANKIREIENLNGWDLKVLLPDSGLAFFESYILFLLKKVRSNPKLFAEEYLKSEIADSKFAKEAYDKMLFFDRLPQLQLDETLLTVAANHAHDIGESGTVGHISSSGENLKVRVEKEGNFSSCGENLSYGLFDPVTTIVSQLIDEGLPQRSNRFNILNETFTHVGIATAPHSIHKKVSVIVFGRK